MPIAAVKDAWRRKTCSGALTIVTNPIAPWVVALQPVGAHLAADGIQIACSTTDSGSIGARQSALLHRDRADLFS